MTEVDTAFDHVDHFSHPTRLEEDAMYSLIRSVSLRNLLVEQLPVLILSMIIAEVFYKFHSFTLETIAFLTTWFVLDWVVQFFLDKVRRPATQPHP